RRLLRRRAVLESKTADLPDPDGDTGPDRELVDLERDRRRQAHGVGTAPGADPTLDQLEQRQDEAVLGPGRELELELDRSFDPGHHAKEGARGPVTELMTPLVATDGEPVDHPGRPGRRAEGRLEQHGVTQVLP